MHLFSSILLGKNGVCPRDTFQITVPWFCSNKAETLSKEFFFLVKSVETTWAHERYIYGFGTLTELFISSSTQKKNLPNYIMKPDTPIWCLDTMHTGLRHKWVNLKAIYSCFIVNQFFKPLYHVAGGSFCLFFYHRHAVYQITDCTVDSCALSLCWLNSLFKTRNGFVVLMEDKVKLLLYIM